MTLRKSDKIIAIVGIIILIIAGIGIFVYMDTEDDNGDQNGDTDKMKYYQVESKMTFSSLPDKSESKIKIKLLGGADFSFKHEIIDENVINISVTVRYTDENPGLLGRFLGQDTLTINVVDSDGNKVGSGTQTGSGKIEFDIDGPAMEIQGPIEAESYEEANQILKEMYEPFSETYKFNFLILSVKGHRRYSRLRQNSCSLPRLHLGGRKIPCSNVRANTIPTTKPFPQIGLSTTGILSRTAAGKKAMTVPNNTGRPMIRPLSNWKPSSLTP